MIFINTMFASLLHAQEVRLAVSNTCNTQRQEVVGFDITEVRNRLGISEEEPFVVKNALGQLVNYQVTHDKMLLVDVCVRPQGKAVFTVSKGFPQPARVQVSGAEYPFRKNDLAWENDRVGFRIYGPQFQRDGDIGNGIDVWVKNSPDIVLPQLYENNCFRGISFHKDHGYGLDCYGVGPSLGCGAPALMLGDSLVLGGCYRHYEILDNGPLRFTVRLDFAPVRVGKSRQVTEHRIITMDKGSHFCRMTVWYDGLQGPHDVATGVVLHDNPMLQAEDGAQTPSTEKIGMGDEWIAYADPTQAPDKHQFEIYVAALFPSARSAQRADTGKSSPSIETLVRQKPYTKFGIWGHLLGIRRNLHDGERFTYYFGAAWSKADIRNFSMWKHCVSDELDALHRPLIGSVE